METYHYIISIGYETMLSRGNLKSSDDPLRVYAGLLRKSTADKEYDHKVEVLHNTYPHLCRPRNLRDSPPLGLCGL